MRPLIKKGVAGQVWRLPGHLVDVLVERPGQVVGRQQVHAPVADERRPGGYPTPVTHASGNDAVFVGRIREDISHPRGLNLWIVSDNIRKGAALNAVQVAELVAKNG